MTAASSSSSKPSPQVPRWLVRTIWTAHRTLYRVSRGRLGLRRPTATQWGMLRLHTIGRNTGKERIAILGYIEDGLDLVVPAMNGWADPEPAWWLNLQDRPDAMVALPDGSTRRVTATAAIGDERARLWRRLVDLGTTAYTDANAMLRSRETAIIMLRPID